MGATGETGSSKRKQYRGQVYPCKSAVAAAKKTLPKPNGRSSASPPTAEALLVFRSEVALAPVHP